MRAAASACRRALIRRRRIRHLFHRRSAAVIYDLKAGAPTRKVFVEARGGSGAWARVAAGFCAKAYADVVLDLRARWRYGGIAVKLDQGAGRAVGGGRVEVRGEAGRYVK